MKTLKVGVIGCGMISDAYLGASKRFPMIEVVACADLNMAAAQAKAEQYGIRALTVDELLGASDIELVINLTVPKAHAEIARRTLEAGKHAYSEKPFGVNSDEAAGLLKLAQAKGLRIGCAPDTFMGGGQQTARKLLDDGWIGKPLAGTAIVMGRGPEKWVHAPFFYDIGGGPMLDLGPYYITALVNLLGPAVAVTAVTLKGADWRECGADSTPPYKRYPVNVTTHLSGMVEFANGAVITVITSFEVWGHHHTPIEIYGDQGTLAVPDPNSFGGPVKLLRGGQPEWHDCPLSHIYTEQSRSIGVADMAVALQSGTAHRASGELANHVLEIMLAFDRSSAAGAKVMLTSSCRRPEALPLGLRDGQLTLG